MDLTQVVLGGVQVHVAGGNPTIHLAQPDEQAALAKLSEQVATDAFHDAVDVLDEALCHPGTRESVLLRLVARVETSNWKEKPLTWMHGAAGAGKSAIMRTLANRLAHSKSLLASFFFRSSSRRNTHEHLVPTIAYQLCEHVEGFRERIATSIHRHPLIFSRPLAAQLNTLVIDPIQQLHKEGRIPKDIPHVIVVDGLDECTSSRSQRIVVDALTDLSNPGVWPSRLSIVVASRPEHFIAGLFENSSVANKCIQEPLHLDDQASADIRLFLTDKFIHIKQTHRLRHLLPPKEWPPSHVITFLVEKASGQFIFAATVIRFIEVDRANPDERLQIILGRLPPGNLEPYRELDALYILIFSVVDEDELPDVQVALGLFIIPHEPCLYSAIAVMGMQKLSPLTPSAVETLLGRPRGFCQQIFYDLSSLLDIDGGKDTITFFHKSLADFLLDVRRSKRFHVRPETCYGFVLTQVVHNDLWYPDVKLCRFITAHIKSIIMKAQKTPELVNLLHQMRFPAMKQRVQKRIGAGARRGDGASFPWFWTVHALIEGIKEADFEGASTITRVLLPPLVSELRSRVVVYKEDAALWAVLYMASRQDRPFGLDQESCGFPIDSVYRESYEDLPFYKQDRIYGLHLATHSAGRWYADDSVRTQGTILFLRPGPVLDVVFEAFPEFQSFTDNYYTSFLAGVTDLSLRTGNLATFLAKSGLIADMADWAPRGHPSLSALLVRFLERFRNDLCDRNRERLEAYVSPRALRFETPPASPIAGSHGEFA